MIILQSYKVTKLPADLRPVNTLPVQEKILEEIVKYQLEEFLENCNIIVNNQSGFRKKHSCESVINDVLYDWKSSLENKLVTIAVFLDLKRAFETVNRQLLFRKMMMYGIQGKEIRWFESYFMHRKQQVKIKNELSCKREIYHGVSQGSALGPLLFLLYINDLPNYVSNSTIYMFADDTLITISAKNIDEATEKLNADLKKISDWMNYNKLVLNVEKTKYMIIKRSKTIDENIEIKWNNNNIMRVKEIKYLGVIIDEKLKFTSHLKFVKDKMHNKLAIFRRLDSKLNAETKILMYKSLVAPHIDYCSSVLFTLRNNQINELQVIQNKFLRNILRVDRYANRNIMLMAIGFLSVEQRLGYLALKFIHKIENDMMPNYLKKILKKNKEKTKYNLRRKSLYEIPNFNSDSTQNSFFYKSIKLYNEFKLKYEKENLSNKRVFNSIAVKFVKEIYKI
jgi:hypothetical protein